MPIQPQFLRIRAYPQPTQSAPGFAQRGPSLRYRFSAGWSLMTPLLLSLVRRLFYDLALVSVANYCVIITY